MKEYVYFSVLFFTVIICFIASFDKRIQFYKHFAPFLLAAIVVAIPFIAWDVWFTAHGVWWFNTDYTVGLKIQGLPIEEWLFFICIPFSCVFTYFCIDKFFRLEWTEGFNNIIVFILVIGGSLVALLHHEKIYTFVTATVLTLSLIFLHFFVRASWIGKATLVFALLLLGFFPVNGVLTGYGLDSPVVNYNEEEILGIRLITIPIEDMAYGYTQFMLVVYFFKLFQKTFARNVKQ